MIPRSFLLLDFLGSVNLSHSFSGPGAPRYVLMTAFPRKVWAELDVTAFLTKQQILDDQSVTLQDGGLTPSATLHMKPVAY